jgi:lipopolysaccharide transport system ATP-binding protein
MSSDLAIRVEGLGKAYTIRHQQSDHVTLAQVALERAKHPLRRNEREQFWALEDVSFEVKQGEVLGVIGRNGAGKSTLLKLLTRITGPTTGRIDLWGRVGSLLEVGTGFHPELTGRENVYLNGSILGMTRKEIDRQFDAIVDFAGVARFLDTPVKRYSSGMYVRLAFAVAAHLETEILLVDEVLAVGDADFQARCLDKMRDVTNAGRTVLFVSHQMPSIRSLCDQVIVLESGKTAFAGGVDAALRAYLEAQTRPDAVARRRPGLDGDIQIGRVWPERPHFDPDEEKSIRFTLHRGKAGLDRCFISVVIRTSSGVPVAHCDSSTVGKWYVVKDEVVEGAFSLQTPWLVPGDYYVDMAVCNAGVYDELEQACRFSVLPALPYSAPPTQETAARDLVLPDYQFCQESTPKQRDSTIDASKSTTT